MNCKDIMTPNPLSCLPSDPVSIAAQIMRRNDVGSVLVVSEHTDNRLLGIVTDRDLALKIIADARDPHTTRVDEAMTLNPVCCREDESTDHALRLMAEHQVRRIPVVDNQGRLVGIVAQADVARHEDEKQVGRVIEQISEPYPSTGWNGESESGRVWTGRGAPLALGALCMGIGAGLMYALSPIRRSESSPAESSEGASESEHGELSDVQLASRIRSRIPRTIARPKAIEVTCRGGHVILAGPVLASDVRQVLDSVTAVGGVRSVQSRLNVHETRESLDEATGGRGWKATSRLFAGLAGSGALLYGMRPKARTGATTRSDVPGF